jgi:hypothetical protein
MRKGFSAGVIKSRETEHTFWIPGLKTYLTMIRCEPKEACICIGGALLIVVIILLLALIPCLFLDPIDRSAGRSPRPIEQPMSEDVKSYFRARLAYHGLHKQVSVVYDYPEKPYFIREGRRCRF